MSSCSQGIEQLLSSFPSSLGTNTTWPHSSESPFLLCGKYISQSTDAYLIDGIIFNLLYALQLAFLLSFFNLLCPYLLEVSHAFEMKLLYLTVQLTSQKCICCKLANFSIIALFSIATVDYNYDLAAVYFDANELSEMETKTYN